MLINKDKINTVIPQAEPFVMIDELLEAGPTLFKSSFTIAKDNIFLDGNTFSESGVIESVAQTCAAAFGYLSGSQKADDKPIGFIGAVSKLTVFENVLVHEKIETQIEVLNSFDKIQLVQGTVTKGNQTVLTCQMKIVNP